MCEFILDLSKYQFDKIILNQNSLQPHQLKKFFPVVMEITQTKAKVTIFNSEYMNVCCHVSVM